jgi:2-(1,2-epoxy-1,2-dihydrophenyl)acetyl-CoA isomerase
MEYRHIIFEVTEEVAKITFNRPDVLNSFNRQMALELQNALSYSDTNQEVRAVYITGAGRAFSAGQDLSEVATTPDDINTDTGEIVRNSFNPIIRLIRTIEKPVVAAVNGVAAGAGANIALACDIVFAAHTASFIQSFIKIGLIPDSGGTFFLPRLIGLPRAIAAMMTGDKITAEHALEMGMIYKVCESELLQMHAFSLAKQLASQPTKSIGLIKRAINQSCSNSFGDQLDLEEKLQSEAGSSYDYMEGVRAFIEKREPKFRGR